MARFNRLWRLRPNAMDETPTPDLPKVWVAPASRDGLALAVRSFSDDDGRRLTPQQEQVIVTRWRPLALDSSWHDEFGRVWLTTGFSESANRRFLTVSLATFGSVRQEPIGPPLTGSGVAGFVAPAGWQLVNKANQDAPVAKLAIREFMSYRLQFRTGTDGRTPSGINWNSQADEPSFTRDGVLCTVLEGEQWGTPNDTWAIDLDNDKWGTQAATSGSSLQPRGWLWPATCAGDDCMVGIAMRSRDTVVNPDLFRSGLGAAVAAGEAWPAQSDALRSTYDDGSTPSWAVALFVLAADYDPNQVGDFGTVGIQELETEDFLISGADSLAGREVPKYSKGSIIELKSAG